VMVVMDEVVRDIHRNHNTLRYTNRAQEASAGAPERTGRESR